MLESIGPQDAEQCIPPWIGQGMDHGDFVLAFSPKPYLILSAIRDFFSINGVRETYQEAQHVYSVMGAGDKVSEFEADNGHGYLQPRRMAAYQWLDRWFKGREDDAAEAPVAPASEEELRCTDSGQVTAALGGETVFSLNQTRLDEVRPPRPALNDAAAVAAFRKAIQGKVERLVGYDHFSGSLNVKAFGVIHNDGFHIEKLTYESEPGIIIPSLLFVPENGEGRRPGMLYVNSRGKADSGGEIEALVKSGMVVLAIDARGWGETSRKTNWDEGGWDTWNSLFPNYDCAMIALLLGKSLVVMRGEDISRGLDLLASRPEIDDGKLYGMGVGAATIPLLHHAVLDPRLKKVVLEGGLVSYESVEKYRIQRGIIENVIPGVLKAYDLPELVAALAPRDVWIVDAGDPLGYRVGINKVRGQYAGAIEAYKSMGAQGALRIEATEPRDEFNATYRGLK
jgi:hypothetical protein